MSTVRKNLKVDKDTGHNKNNILHVYDGFSAEFIGKYDPKLKKDVKWDYAPLKNGGTKNNVILVYPNSLTKDDINEYHNFLDKHRIDKNSKSIRPFPKY